MTKKERKKNNMKLDKARIIKVDHYDEYGKFSYSHYLVEYEAKFLWFFRRWRMVQEYHGSIAGTFAENKRFKTIFDAEEYIADERKKVKPKTETEIIIFKTLDDLYHAYLRGVKFDSSGKWCKNVKNEHNEWYHPENYTKEEFVEMLTLNDEFYEKWGQDSCVTLSYRERYDIWFANNYETGFERNPEIVIDFENPYWTATPKRKLKKSFEYV
jgi:hypothetical protein